MSLHPVGARVVVRRDADPSVSTGGVVLPVYSRKHAQLGEVVAVHSGRLRQPDVLPGDRVVFGLYAGTDVTHDGETLTVMPEEEIIAVIAVLE